MTQSAYEKDRMITEEFGRTEMGRDLLAQDYLLKQLTASLIYPENELGKKFWQKVHQQVWEQFNTNDVPMDTFNKVWIVPEKAVVVENANSAFVVESKLKVMLEADYLAMRETQDRLSEARDDSQDMNQLGSQIVREIIIPAIEKEVNEGQNFAQLRQVYHSLILASWFKDNLKEALVNQVYANQKKTLGVEVDDKTIKDQIYEQYLAAYKKGVFNYIKEEYDLAIQETIPRKYFSGGTKMAVREIRQDQKLDPTDPAMVAQVTEALAAVGQDVKATVRLNEHGSDTAMRAELKDKLVGVQLAQALRDDIEQGFINDQNHGEIIDVLNDLGESELFADWDPAGTHMEEKQQFLNELVSLHREQLNGLKGYKQFGIDLIKSVKENEDPLKGLNLSAPPMVDLTKLDDKFTRLENKGLENVGRLGFVKVAGGVGDRLGYKGPKVTIPFDLVTGKSFIQIDIEHILALQDAYNRSNGTSRKLRLTLMTSEDNHEATLAFLRQNNFFGMDGMTVIDTTRKLGAEEQIGQISVLKQKPILAYNDAQGKFVKASKYKMVTKPGGHGDIHELINKTGLAERWRQEGFDYTLFFQDTNVPVWNSVLPGLATTIDTNFDLNFMVVNRKPAESVGSIIYTQNPSTGQTQTRNWEYNYVKKSPQASSTDADGYSIYPGNMNVFFLRNDAYIPTLQQNNGKFGIIFNPKMDSEGKFKSPARPETNMQDIAQVLQAEKVGVTKFDDRFVFSAVKNNFAEAKVRLDGGAYSEHLSSGTGNYYKNNRIRLDQAGVRFTGAGVNGRVRTSQNVPWDDGAKVIFSPQFGMTNDSLRARFANSQTTISDRSVVLLEGRDIAFEGENNIDGTVLIKIHPEASLTIQNVDINNEGWSITDLTATEMADDSTTPQYLKMRGYKITEQESFIVNITQPGRYMLRQNTVYRMEQDGWQEFNASDLHAQFAPLQRKDTALTANLENARLFMPTIRFEKGRAVDPSEIRRRIDEKRRTPEQVIEMVRQHLESGQQLTMEAYLRGIDGAGSSIDLTKWQERLVDLGISTFDELPATTVIASGFKSKVRFELASDPEVIEYVAPAYGITAANPYRITGPVQMDADGRLANRQKDAPAYIFRNLFGLKGIRIVMDEMPAIAKAGGMESSNAFNTFLVTAASILSGADLSFADITALAVFMENHELRGGTGGQGHWSSILGGAKRLRWVSGVKNSSGQLINNYGVVVEELLTDNQLANIENHVMLVQLGKQYTDDGKEFLPTPLHKRAADLTNDIWTHLMEFDDRGREIALLMKDLAYQYSQAFISGDFSTARRINDQYVDLRNELTIKGMNFIADVGEDKEGLPDYVQELGRKVFDPSTGKDYEANAPIREEFTRQQQAGKVDEFRQTSLYTLGANEFIMQARQKGISLFALGAGGPGAIYMAISDQGLDHLQAFFQSKGLGQITDEDAQSVMTPSSEPTGVIRTLQGYMPFKAGRGPIKFSGFEKLSDSNGRNVNIPELEVVRTIAGSEIGLDGAMLSHPDFYSTLEQDGQAIVLLWEKKRHPGKTIALREQASTLAKALGYSSYDSEEYVGLGSPVGDHRNKAEEMKSAISGYLQTRNKELLEKDRVESGGPQADPTNLNNQGLLRPEGRDPVGGIDLQSTQDNITVDKQNGGINIQFNPQQLEDIRLRGVEGFVPVIINVVPIPSVLPILGMEPKREEELQLTQG